MTVAATYAAKTQITFEAYKDRFVRLGASDAMAQGYTDLAWAKNQGLDKGVQRTPQNSTPTLGGVIPAVCPFTGAHRNQCPLLA